MRLRDDRSHYTFRGADFELRAWDDPQRIEKPIFLIEQFEGDKLLDGNREALARTLAERVGLKPDQITWLEQVGDGNLNRFEFFYSHTQTIIPAIHDMDVNDGHEAAGKGEILSQKIERYDSYRRAVSPEERQTFQKLTESALESSRELQERIDYNTAQETALRDTKLPDSPLRNEQSAELKLEEPNLAV